jgi:thiamine monophosphate synthase
VSLSPVCRTEKYAEGEQLGWDKFQALADKVSLPVYALGGIRRSDSDTARFHGGHGIAGIKTFL